ncbi:60S acidic ribosomal protein P1-like [Leopardus geoffroyi]|uniref:60S acidic ribosomal protein P1-like n=1 Tax=Leopardus geoffroyi TaxID=46844 RepID=UPI001E25D9E8|nr:60S acidic ribosomal protein P1-like [Leopardus geoffroyi]
MAQPLSSAAAKVLGPTEEASLYPAAPNLPTSAFVWELEGIYSGLTVQDDEVSVKEDEINALIKTVGVNVESFWPGLFAKALAHVNIVNIRSFVRKVGAGGSVPAAGPAPSTTAAPTEEKKVEAKEEESEESDDDVGFSLLTKSLL